MTRKTVMTLMLPVMVGMMLAQPVSAQNHYYVAVPDVPGDIAGVYDWTGDMLPIHLYNENSRLGRIGYLDMLLMELEQDGDTFTFRMTLAGNLPSPGDPIPYGFSHVRWNLWLDAEPWPSDEPITSFYAIWIVYDGLDYYAEIGNYATETLERLAQTPLVSGSTVELTFTWKDIGYLDTFWFNAGVKVLKHPDPGLLPLGCLFVTDFTDPEAVEHQESLSIPWPYPPV
jgi:hypothetical protein